jgi:hypothetical protein
MDVRTTSSGVLCYNVLMVKELTKLWMRRSIQAKDIYILWTI